MRSTIPGQAGHHSHRSVAGLVVPTALLLFAAGPAPAQELVPNGSFEDVLQCPSGPSQLAGTTFWTDPTGNLTGTPDFYHTCGTGTHGVPNAYFGFQEPQHGDGYAGIFLYEGSTVLANWREYLQVELHEELVQDRCYHVRLFANLTDISSRTTDALGLRFYPQAVFLPNPYPPGDEPHLELPAGTFLNTTDWTLLEGDYVAAGGERFLMIGNYRDNANTTVQQLSTNGSAAYALIDAVSVMPCLPTGAAAQAIAQPRLQADDRGFILPGASPAAHYRITDPLGRLMQAGRITTARIDVAASAHGVLLLSVYDGGQVWHYRVYRP